MMPSEAEAEVGRDRSKLASWQGRRNMPRGIPREPSQIIPRGLIDSYTHVNIIVLTLLRV